MVAKLVIDIEPVLCHNLGSVGDKIKCKITRQDYKGHIAVDSLTTICDATLFFIKSLNLKLIIDYIPYGNDFGLVTQRYYLELIGLAQFSLALADDAPKIIID